MPEASGSKRQVSRWTPAAFRQASRTFIAEPEGQEAGLAAATRIKPQRHLSPSDRPKKFNLSGWRKPAWILAVAALIAAPAAIWQNRNRSLSHLPRAARAARAPSAAKKNRASTSAQQRDERHGQSPKQEALPAAALVGPELPPAIATCAASAKAGINQVLDVQAITAAPLGAAVLIAGPEIASAASRDPFQAPIESAKPAATLVVPEIPPEIRVLGVLWTRDNQPIAVLTIPGRSDPVFVQTGDVIRIQNVKDGQAEGSFHLTVGQIAESSVQVFPADAPERVTIIR